MSWIEAERARCRRPITADEVAGLEALGDELRRLRREVAGLSRVRLGICAEMSDRQIEQVERGIRRTRRSTLERIALVLVEGRPDLGIEGRPELGHADALAERLAALAGVGLAPESSHRDRVEKRRKSRWKRMERQVLYRYIMPMMVAEIDAEMRDERRTIRESRRRNLMRG